MSKIEELPTSDVEEATYDSKNSDVYLAYVDAPVKETDELQIEDSFIGGEPIWLHPESIPSDDLLKCGACKSKENMKLLLQAFSPLDDEQMETVQNKYGINNLDNINPEDDRVLYVFVCTNCQRKGNSIRCIRGVKQNKSNSINEKITNVSEGKDFNINPFDLSKANEANPNSNPFDSNPFQLSHSDNSANPFDNFKTDTKESAENTRKKDKEPEVSVKVTRKLHDAKNDKSFDREKCFKSYLLYVEEERFNKKPDHLKLPSNLKINKEALELTGNNEDDLEKNPVKLDPKTEKLAQFLDDDTFQKFQEIVGYNPLQVLRYDVGGKPLYFAQVNKKFEDIVATPNYNPSSRRIFEMQLMPKMILDLEESAVVESGMEWGTILVFTDIENYSPNFDEHGVCYVEEVVKVQWETRD